MTPMMIGDVHWQASISQMSASRVVRDMGRTLPSAHRAVAQDRTARHPAQSLELVLGAAAEGATWARA